MGVMQFSLGLVRYKPSGNQKLMLVGNFYKLYGNVIFSYLHCCNFSFFWLETETDK